MRRRWTEAGWPRRTRQTVTGTRRSAGPTPWMASTRYVRQQARTGNSVSPRCCTRVRRQPPAGGVLRAEAGRRRGHRRRDVAAYGGALEDNLRDLAVRIKRGAFGASPVRRAYIPKADGRPRPSAFRGWRTNSSSVPSSRCWCWRQRPCHGSARQAPVAVRRPTDPARSPLDETAEAESEGPCAGECP